MRWLLTSLLAGALCAAALHAPDRWLASLLVMSALAVLAIVGLDELPAQPARNRVLADWAMPLPTAADGKAVRRG